MSKGPEGTGLTGSLWAAGFLASVFSFDAAAVFSETDDSRIRITAPSDSLSPSLTLSSLTTPAPGEGISIVALSDSSEMSDCSLATVSPGLTRISMTSTSLKSPMSGTFTSLAAMEGFLKNQLADVGEHRDEMAGEARAVRAVDDAVIVGESDRQHQARHELLAAPHRAQRAARHAEDRDFGRVDDRRESRAADSAQAGDRE